MNNRKNLKNRPKHEGPKDASEIEICYTPIEYVKAGRVILANSRKEYEHKKSVNKIK